MRPMYNEEDGFPEHDMDTILKYDSAALAEEKARTEQNITTMEAKIRELSAKRFALLRQEEKGGENTFARNQITKAIDALEVDKRRFQKYSERLGSYILLIRQKEKAPSDDSKV